MCSFLTYGQDSIEGIVYNEYLEYFYNAKVTIGERTVNTDENGTFKITNFDNKNKFFKVSAFGYKTEELPVELGKKVNVILKENLKLEEVVISASRVAERIIESPVTIERLAINDFKKNSSGSFYDRLNTLKGVNARTINYGYNSVNTRGFSDFNTSRFVQLIDGVDNASPGLNFSQGNVGGVSELDILSMELLPGASSALYGANAYNGILLMNTKSPFDYTGISAMIKGGVTSQNGVGTNPFHDIAIRMAHKFNNKFAAKVNLSYNEVEQWHANDTRSRAVDTNEVQELTFADTYDFDGINTYGDELFNSITFLDQNLEEVFINFRRQGYKERDLLKTTKFRNIKFSSSLQFRPFEDESFQIELANAITIGDNVFQGTSRFALKDYYYSQSKLELKGNNFYVRGYLSTNDAGNSYDLARTGVLINEDASPFYSTWLLDLEDELFFQNTSFDEAFNYAERNRFEPGSKEFSESFNKHTANLISNGGSRIYDKSYFYHAEGNYNFTSLLNDWADVQLGGSYREYHPDSKGTIFNDLDTPINVYEYGAYAQIQKKFFNNRLKLTSSLRYDKSENFEATYSPRFALNFGVDKSNNNIIRVSYQTGFRIPTIQEQYLYNEAGIKRSIGFSKDNLDRIKIYNPNENLYEPTITTKDDILNNALLTSSVFETGTFIKSDYKELVPEDVKTIELGYRGILPFFDGNLDIDINGFYSRHQNFVTYQDIVVPTYGTVYPNGSTILSDEEAQIAIDNGALVNENNIVILDPLANEALDFFDGANEFNIITNSKSDVSSYGAAISLHSKIFKKFDVNLVYDFIDFSLVDKDNGFFEPNFNTPKHSVKAQLANNNLLKNLGFSVGARWQTSFRWVSPFVKGNVPERTVIDAQLNYRIPAMKSRLQIGGTNLFGKEYFVAPGSGQVGKMYYLSWIINN
ncbi:MAG: TonB-dependent receptor plug domain-containing protein [Tenacibaculum sp.]